MCNHALTKSEENKKKKKVEKDKCFTRCRRIFFLIISCSVHIICSHVITKSEEKKKKEKKIVGKCLCRRIKISW